MSIELNRLDNSLSQVGRAQDDNEDEQFNMNSIKLEPSMYKNDSLSDNLTSQSHDDWVYDLERPAGIN